MRVLFCTVQDEQCNKKMNPLLINLLLKNWFCEFAKPFSFAQYNNFQNILSDVNKLYPTLEVWNPNL